MIMVLIFAFWSEHVQQRSPFIMAGFSIAAIGFIGQLVIPHPGLPGLTYGFLFPVAAGLYCPFIQIVCWIGKPLFATSSSCIHTDGFRRQQPRPIVEACRRHGPPDLCRELWRSRG